MKSHSSHSADATVVLCLLRPVCFCFSAGDAGVVRLAASGVPSRQLMLDALTLLIIDQTQTVPTEIARTSNQYNPHPCVYQAKVHTTTRTTYVQVYAQKAKAVSAPD